MESSGCGLHPCAQVFVSLQQCTTSLLPCKRLVLKKERHIFYRSFYYVYILHFNETAENGDVTSVSLRCLSNVLFYDGNISAITLFIHC